MRGSRLATNPKIVDMQKFLEEYINIFCGMSDIRGEPVAVKRLLEAVSQFFGDDGFAKKPTMMENFLAERKGEA